MSTWKYSRMYNRQQTTPVNKIVDPTIPDRLVKLLALSILTEWERTFCESIQASFVKFKGLTVGQNETLSKIETRHDDRAVAARNEWEKKFSESDELKHAWEVMIKYYSTTQYYKGAVQRWEKDKNYIPNEREFDSICNNVYAQRMLKQMDEAPKFAVGDLCVIEQYSTHSLATVISVGNVSGPQKGSRQYVVSAIGADFAPYPTEERYMKRYSPRYDEKIQKGWSPF